MPHNDDKFLLLLDKISEIGERTARMEVEQRNMKDDMSDVKDDIGVIKIDLAEHIQGTITNRQRLDVEIENRKVLESRVSTLEEAPKFLASLKKYLLYIAAVGGAIMAIMKFFPK